MIIALVFEDIFWMSIFVFYRTTEVVATVEPELLASRLAQLLFKREQTTVRENKHLGVPKFAQNDAHAQHPSSMISEVYKEASSRILRWIGIIYLQSRL